MHKFLHLRVSIKGAYFLVFLSFLVALSLSFLSPIFPLYIKSLVKTDAYVGYISAITALLFLIANLIVAKFLINYKKRSLLKIGLLGSAITVVFFSIINKVHYFLLLEIIRSFFLVSIFVTLALFIRDYASSKNLGKTEGMHFTVSNIAWLIGPLLGAMLADKYSMQTMFMLGSIFPLAALFFVLICPIKENKITISNHNHTLENIKNYFKDKDLKILYFISLGLMIWWSVVYTFTPLFIKENNMSTSTVGYLLFLVTIPLILLEIPVGRLADKKGFRKFFFLGFVIIAISSGLMYFFSAMHALIFIVLASFGAALLEPLRETYILEKLNKGGLANSYTIYRTSIEAGHIIGPIIFSTILFFTNFKILYLSASVLMLLLAVCSLRIKDIKNEIYNR